MVKLLPGAHVNIGFVLVRRLEWCQHKVKNQEEEAYRQPGSYKGAEGVGLHFGIGPDKRLQGREYVIDQYYRVEVR